MAQMIPNELLDCHDSYGEKQVFNALKKLPKEYVVFHSVRWNSKNEKKRYVYGECDFTIFHHDKGILVIEVKSGGIECINGEWKYIRSDNGERYQMNNPLEQADKSKFKFIDMLKEQFADTKNTDSPQYCHVESAVWFPSIKKRDIVGSLPPEFTEDKVLFEDALENPEKYIDRLYKSFQSAKQTNLNRTDNSTIINLFSPNFNVMQSLSSKRLEQEEIFIRLTNEQNALLDYLEEQNIATIQGAAGTGKTFLAVEKAIRLAETGKVLFLCYNKFLKEFLQENKEQKPKKYQNIEFYNLEQLACKLLQMREVDETDIIRLLDNFEKYEEWDYKHIVIDEGQDFKGIEIEKLKEIAIFNDGAFYVFFDKNQFVQRKDNELPKWLTESECRLILSTNCRNTCQIATTSGKPIGLKPNTKKSAIGDRPVLYIRENIAKSKKQISKLIDEYRINGYEYSQICILTVKTEEKSILSDCEKIGTHTIARRREKNSVFFTTSRKFKGLESDAIIIIDIDEDTFKTEENKKLFYVGTSRAKHSLSLIFTGDEEQFDLMAKEVKDDSSKTSKFNITLGLDVKVDQGEI